MALKKFKKLFLDAVRKSWAREFPFLKEIRDQTLKTPVFVCDKYFEARDRVYRFWFNFSRIKPGRVYLEIEVLDGKTPLYLIKGGKPSASQMGFYRIGAFEGKAIHEGWHISGRADIELDELNRRIESCILDINERLKTKVFPILEIE